MSGEHKDVKRRGKYLLFWKGVFLLKSVHVALQDSWRVAKYNIIKHSKKPKHIKYDIFSSAMNLFSLFLDSGEDVWSVWPTSESCQIRGKEELGCYRSCKLLLSWAFHME